MAGHSKWANIQHRKNAQDAKRGKIFTKLIREVTVAARLSGPDPEANPRLRTALDKAYTANMSRDTIARAIKRGTGEGAEADTLEEIRYEGYGPQGVAFMVDCLTDNRNRTVSEVRHVFTKHGGNLGTEGSVAYLFQKRAQWVFGPDVSEEAVFEAAIEAGADSVDHLEDGAIEVLSDPVQWQSLQHAFLERGCTSALADVLYLPYTCITVGGEARLVIEKMIDTLEDLDDVQHVYTNAEWQ